MKEAKLSWHCRLKREGAGDYIFDENFTQTYDEYEGLSDLTDYEKAIMENYSDDYTDGYDYSNFDHYNSGDPAPAAAPTPAPVPEPEGEDYPVVATTPVPERVEEEPAESDMEERIRQEGPGAAGYISI